MILRMHTGLAKYALLHMYTSLSCKGFSWDLVATIDLRLGQTSGSARRRERCSAKLTAEKRYQSCCRGDGAQNRVTSSLSAPHGPVETNQSPRYAQGCSCHYKSSTPIILTIDNTGAECGGNHGRTCVFQPCTLRHDMRTTCTTCSATFSMYVQSCATGSSRLRRDKRFWLFCG